MIHHRPYLNVEKVAKFYSEKDGVPIKYVCTSAISGEAQAGDIFFRETPHPDFGNRYFMLFNKYNIWDEKAPPQLMITNADKIENAEFFMVKGDKGFEYSQHRHDYYHVEGSGVNVDGGRAYFRCVGDIHTMNKQEFKVKDGEFIEVVPEGIATIP